MTKAAKAEFIALRMSTEEAQVLRAQAEQAGITLSELIRRRVAGQLIVSRTDEETAKSIDRLGRLLKHLYPKGQGWATPEDRKRWWTLIGELERTARSLLHRAPL